MTRRRVALLLAAVPLLLLALLAAVPLLFRGRIEEGLRGAVNRGLTAQVAWQDVGLSLFRDFPNLAVRLDGLSVTGTDRFAGDTLLAVPRLQLVLDLGSVLRSVRGTGPVVVRSVDLQGPAARLLVLEDGARSWDIVRPSPDTAAPSERALAVSLRGLELRAGRITYDDRHAGIQAYVTGLSESLRGDFARERFTLETRTAADSVSLSFRGLPWLSRVRLGIDADLDVDGAAQRVTVAENEIRLNELVLALTGSAVAAADSVALDLAFTAPGTAFADILSLVPAVYARSFATLQTAGTMQVKGTVRGGYGAHTFPALDIRAQVADGMFRYPDLPLPARDVTLDLAITNPGGSADSTVVRLDRLHLVMGGDPIDGAFVMRTPVSDPDVELRLAGRLDLADLGRTVKLEGVQELAGVVVADAGMRARRSDVAARRYDRVHASGGVRVTGLAVRTTELPHPLQLDEAELKLTPRHAELTSLRGRIGSSDVQATGSLENLLGFVLYREDLRGAAQLTSTRFDLNEWRSDDELKIVMVPGRIDFALQATVGQLTFGTLDMRAARGALRVKDRRVTLEDFRVNMLDGSVAMSGWYETLDAVPPTFDMDLDVTDVDVPAAFAGIRTVQAFAPVARYVQGRVSADLKLNGALGEDMMPVREVLSGLGSLRTVGVSLQDFPPLARLADAVKVEQLRNPAFKDLQSTIEIRDGRLHVRPFDVSVAGFTMNVAGSNGFDQSLAYTLGLQLPRSLLGAETNRLVSNLVTQAGRTGIDIENAAVVNLGVQLGGTITNPSVATSLRDATGSAAAAIAQSLRQEAASRVDSARQRLDAEAARRRAAAQQRIIEEAEARAASIRAEARTLAATMQREAQERADSLVARAGNPIAKVAAEAAAARLRKETDAKADRLVAEADARADALVAEARRRAAAPDSVPTP